MAPKAKEKPKPSQSPSSQPPRSEYEQAVKVSDQVLVVAPGDDDALRCKIVGLIKADNIDLALSTIQASNNVMIDLSFYKERTSAAMQLESQILYRLGKMEACMDVYQKLQKLKIESLEINIVAGLIPAGRASEVQGTMDSLKVKANSSFELAYNTACSLIERKKYTDAEQQLLSSRRIGQEALMDDNWADDEIEIELAPIAVQLAYLDTRRSNSNLRSKDVSDGLRKLDKLIEKGPELVAALSDMFPGSVMPALLQAAISVRENKAVKAEEILVKFANQFPEKSRVALLARAQVAAAASHPQIAAESLVRIPDIQHMPATVATLVSLKERAGDIDGAAAVLDSAISWWSNAMSEDSKLDLIMHDEAASFKLKHGQEEEAARLYENLVKSHGSVEALVGLVTTAARVDVKKAETYEKQLKPLPGLQGVDVDALEKTSGAKHVENGGNLRNIEVYEEPKGKAKSKKRKRKPKYPKGFDPANPVVREKQEANNAASSNTNTTTSKPKPNQPTATTTSKPSSEQSKPSSLKSPKKKSRR
ncbi:Signal recognition particle [Macleaya cordata]|uniref:Signal recognition particle n=1 Tax=Macleaya cordata TaxID=56857 RepID=A0A200PZX0_MACCD|nr:Signal recognition particle [Macleaya cordata]